MAKKDAWRCSIQIIVILLNVVNNVLRDVMAMDFAPASLTIILVFAFTIVDGSKQRNYPMNKP